MVEQYRESSLNVATSTWPEIEARLNAGAIGILPIGAAAKEHGRHLPMNTDYRQAEFFARAAAERVDSVVWPVLSVGYYPVFTEYPGSISLAEPLFEALVREVLDCMIGSGSRRLAIVNTGISTIAGLERVVASVDVNAPIRLINAYSGARFTAATTALSEQPFGGHADEVETSIMLAIDATAVDMERARPQPTQIARGMFNRTDPDGPNYSPDGVNGDPTRATAEKGERFLAAIVDDIVAALTAD